MFCIVCRTCAPGMCLYVFALDSSCCFTIYTYISKLRLPRHRLDRVTWNGFNVRNVCWNQFRHLKLNLHHMSPSEEHINLPSASKGCDFSSVRFQSRFSAQSIEMKWSFCTGVSAKLIERHTSTIFVGPPLARHMVSHRWCCRCLRSYNHNHNT